MSCTTSATFESLESAQEYLALLAEVIRESQQNTEANIFGADSPSSRYIEVLRLISYNLEKLSQHIKSSRRILNDLRMVRRLLQQERAGIAPVRQLPSEASADAVTGTYTAR
jgi:hypothetical protein